MGFSVECRYLTRFYVPTLAADQLLNWQFPSADLFTIVDERMTILNGEKFIPREYVSISLEFCIGLQPVRLYSMCSTKKPPILSYIWKGLVTKEAINGIHKAITIALPRTQSVAPK